MSVLLYFCFDAIPLMTSLNPDVSNCFFYNSKSI